MALVLGDLHAALGVELGGHVVVDRRRGDQDRAGVHALATRQALDGEGGVDDAAVVGIRVVGVHEVLAEEVLLALHLVHRELELGGGVRGDHLGQALALEDREVEHAGGVVDGLLGLDRGVGDNVADAVSTVELADMLDDLEPSLIVEVHIDIRHLRALEGQEPLEHEAVLQGVEGRDVHGVGNDGAGRRATAGSHADAVLLGPPDVLLDDQEVVGEALGADDVVLVLEALADVDAVHGLAVPVITVAHGQSRLALGAEPLLGGLSLLEVREFGQEHRRPVELVVALGRDLERVVAGLGAPGEELAHLVLALEVELGPLHVLAVALVDLGVGADAGQGVLDGGVLAPEVVDVVGGHDLDVELSCELDELLIELAVVVAIAEGKAVVLDLDVEVLAEDVLKSPGPLLGLGHVVVEDELGDDALDAGALADDALVVLLEHIEGGTGPVVKHLVGGLRHHLHEVDVAALVLGQKDQVEAALPRSLFDLVVGDEVGLATEDRFDQGSRLLGPDGGQRLLLVVRGPRRLPGGDVALPLGVHQVVWPRIGSIRLGLLEVPVLGEALEVVRPLLEVLLGRVVAAAGQVEVRDAEHVAVVGQGHGRHPELDRA